MKQKRGVKIPHATFLAIRRVTKRTLQRREESHEATKVFERQGHRGRSPWTPPQERQREIDELRWLLERLDELKDTQLLVFADYTDEQLRTFARRIPWNLEHGTLMRAAERLRGIIEEHLNRHPLVRLAEQAE